MTALDLQPGKAVFILWEDSAQIDGWRKDFKPDVGVISTVGWVVDGNSKALVISSSVNDQFHALSPLSIPWSCIIQCDELEQEWQK